MVLIAQLPVFIRALFRGVTWRMDRHEKVIYLTFDDGPIPEVTPWVLDLLDQSGIKATFFCVGENVMRYPEIYDEIVRRGHRTGNHTYNHLRGFFTNTADYMENVEKAAQYISSNLFRPPHGELKASQLRALRQKFQVVQWDVITHDYSRKISPETVLRITLKYVRRGSIVVFHDSLKAEPNLKYALPKTIDYLVEKGYQFRTL